jgi:hypothetical protein
VARHIRLPSISQSTLLFTHPSGISIIMSSTSLCDACGMPPEPNKQLRNCTRCHSAQYHDAICQKKAWKRHKTFCRRKAAELEKEVAAADAAAPLVTCQILAGKGRALIAVAALTTGCHPLTRIKMGISSNVGTREDGLCAPIVPPTLIESMRRCRCTYCFQLIYTNLLSNLLHAHCSMECRNLDCFWKNEQYASTKLISSGVTSSMPSPTVLTCCRILQSSLVDPVLMEKYNGLCHAKDDGDYSKTEQGSDYFNILTQCHQLLLAMGDTSAAKLAHDLLEPNPILAFQFMSRLTMNAFTICNAEQEILGVGVYFSASFINHSCRPNAVQSFWFSGSDGHHPPMLQITMCRNAVAGEEVTISYCDASVPRDERRKGLKKNYNFLCDCALCQDVDRDDALIGLICAASGRCNGKVRSTSSGNIFDESKQYHCETCGHSNFEDSLNAIAQLMARVEAIEIMRDRTKYSRGLGEDMKQLFCLISKYCNIQTSWYVAWSSDVFIHWCANALKHCLDEEEKLNICHQALSLLNQSRAAAKFCYEYEGSLILLIKKGTEAKLRLFVNPMDTEALSILRVVRRDLMLFYPPTDEIVSSLDESIRAYSYS